MKVKLNGNTVNLNGENSLGDIIKIYLDGREAKGIAAALNSTIIPKQKWSGTILSDNDEVEIVHAVQGG